MTEKAMESMVVHASPKDCYAVVAEFERYPEWAGDIKEVRVLSRDGEGRPLEVAFRAAAFGRSTSYTLSYDYGESPGVLAWVQTKGDLTRKLDGSYRFKKAGKGETEVVYELVADLKVPLPGFIKRRAESRVMHTALRDLKARVESGA